MIDLNAVIGYCSMLSVVTNRAQAAVLECLTSRKCSMTGLRHRP